MADPITDPQWGKADWIDFEHNWREKDAEYLQSRVILRYQNAAARDAALPAPERGMVIYNDTTGKLELRGATSWFPLTPLPINLIPGPDTSTAAGLSHSTAGGNGIIFGPSDIKVAQPIDVLTGLFKIEASGITVRTGSTTAVLTTDADSLVSSVGLKAPKITLTGTGTVISAVGKEIEVGTVNAAQVVTTNMGVSGTLTGGVFNGTTGIIGGVGLGVVPTGTPAAPLGQVEAHNGFLAQAAMFTSDGASALVKARSLPGGAAKAGLVQVDDNVSLNGTEINYLANGIVRNKTLRWADSGGVLRGQYATSIYSATDPGAANFPEGTIWVS